jgi:hypothetical protein
MVLWDEDFAANASGDDSGSEDDDDDDDEEEEEEEMKPDAFRLGLYREATPWVSKLLANNQDRSAKSALEGLNKQIKKQNKKEKINEGELLINLNVLRAIGIEAGVAAKALKEDPNNERAKELQQKAEKQLGTTIRTNHYPPEWLNCLPWNDKKEKKEKSPKKDNDKKEENTSAGQDGDTDMPDVDSSDEKKQKKGNSLTRKHEWKPGETRKGERILGWRPFYRTDRKTGEVVYHGCQFVIEKKGQPNPVALISGASAGRRATDAYRSLPEEEQNDIRHSEKKYTYKDAGKFDRIIGFASKPSESRRKNGYALYSFADGSEELLSLTALRNVFGEVDADNEVEEFYEDIDETPYWLMKPKKLQKLLTNGSELRQRRKSRKHRSDYDSDSDSNSSSDSDSDSDSESDSESSDKKRKRRLLRNNKGSQRSRSSKSNRQSKPKALESNTQSEIFADILGNFMKQLADENKRQTESIIDSVKLLSLQNATPLAGA